MEKLEPSCTIGRTVKWCKHYEKHLEVPQKIENRATNGPANPLLGIYPRELKVGSQLFLFLVPGCTHCSS